jgi:hypothetical protein
MPVRAVADTHAALWYLYDDPRLSDPARAFMDAADASGDPNSIGSTRLFHHRAGFLIALVLRDGTFAVFSRPPSVTQMPVG